MSGGGLVEVLRAEAGGCGRFGLPCHLVHEREFWCWACNHAAHLADVVTAHLAARLEGCREEVAEAIYRGVVIDEAECEGDVAAGALDVVREALGLSPETQGAALSASDGADGPEGHREATKAGDGL